VSSVTFHELGADLLHVDQIEPLTDEQLRRLFDQAAGIKRELDRVGATD
jgi:hypothetical protein